ncbi:MAG: GNAT family N-acetyltransferase [Acidobacteriota bacterium]
MPSEKSLSPKDWVSAGAAKLAAGGLNAIRVEALAQSLGVTKGSFYWHFKNRGALIEAILEDWQQRQTRSIIEQVERSGGDARARLEELSKVASAEADNAIEMTLRDEASRSAEIAAFVRRVDEQRMAYLIELLRDLGHGPLQSEARALLAYSLLIGDYFLDVDHGDGALSRSRVLAECRRLLYGAGTENARQRAESAVTLDLLVHHPAALPTVARWHFEEWASVDPEMSVERVRREKIEPLLNSEGTPFMIVALDAAGAPLGTAGVKLREMDRFPEREHWLSGVYVAGRSRGQGLGSLLIEDCLRRARLAGIETLHLQTEHLDGGLYRQHGFEPVETVDGGGYRALVMSRRL